MGERGDTTMEPMLREILSSEPEIVAWLEPDEAEDAEELPSE